MSLGSINPLASKGYVLKLSIRVSDCSHQHHPWTYKPLLATHRQYVFNKRTSWSIRRHGSCGYVTSPLVLLASSPTSPMSILDPHFQEGHTEKPAEGSEPLFSMYRKMAKNEDIKMAELWLNNTEGLLTFVGTSVLFFHIASNTNSLL
jgi:hypothetical protein